MRDLPARHRSIRAAFDHSWNLLTEEERRAFHGLSVFRGGFDEEAAQVLNSEFKIQNSKSSPGSPDRITNYELRICSPLW
jgi:predicted ATPase